MFYFFNIVIVLYNLLIYAVFRGGIYDYLRLSKMSKTNIKKNSKGFINYLLYQSINKENSLGVLYYINIIYLIYTVVFSFIAVTMGSVMIFRPALLILSVILCIIEIPAVFLASIYNNKLEFGKPFVLFVRRKLTGKFCSSLIDMFSWSVTAFLIYISYFKL